MASLKTSGRFFPNGDAPIKKVVIKSGASADSIHSLQAFPSLA